MHEYDPFGRIIHTTKKDGILVSQVLIQGKFSNKVQFELCAQIGGGYFSSTSSEDRIVHHVSISESGLLHGKEWLQVTKLLQDAIKTVDDHLPNGDEHNA